MHQAVDLGHGHRRIGEGLVPLAEGLIAGGDQIAALVPPIITAPAVMVMVMDLAAYDEQGGNLLISAPAVPAKTHLAAAFGTALADNGKRVLFTRTTDLVQKLQAARRDLALPGTLAKLDRFDVLVLR